MLSLWWIKLRIKWQNTSRARKVILVCLAVVLGAGLLSALGVAPALAADDPTAKNSFVKSMASEVADGLLRAVAWLLSLFATWFMKLAVFFLRFLIEIGSYNGFVNSTAVNVGWVMVRDVTNMFFVIILLIIAFGTILGIEQYEWKKLLVKFILAAVLVNFSRVICGIFIDVAQVVMITFLNGVAATAGGNLITAFKLDQLLSLNSNLKPDDIDSLQVLLANAAALWFAAMAAAIIAGYALMMLARMVMLWILIVLSPLAFVLSVLPQTASQASTWWKEFGNNVIVGPLLAFFLWLAFVTVGGGNIHDEIVNDVKNTGNAIDEANLADQTGALSPGSQTSSGVSGIMRFTEMAGFFIAIGMLFAGVKLTLQFAPAGGGMLQKAAEVGKKAGMIFSGAAAGVWAGRGIAAGAQRAAGATAKWGLMNMPFGGKFWQRKGQTIAAGAGLYWGKGEEWRNKLAEDWEKGLGRGKVAKAFGKVGSRLVESQRRAEKRVKKVTVAKEQQDEMVESASVKGSWEDAVGIAQAGKYEEYERYQAQKKSRKVAEREADQKRAAADVSGARAGLIAARESGDPEKIKAAEQALKEKQKIAKKLQGAQAYGGVPLGEIIEQEMRGEEIGKGLSSEAVAELKMRGYEIPEGEEFGIGKTKYQLADMIKAKAKGELATEGEKNYVENSLLQEKLGITTAEKEEVKKERAETDKVFQAATEGGNLLKGGSPKALRGRAAQLAQDAQQRRAESEKADKEAAQIQNQFNSTPLSDTGKRAELQSQYQEKIAQAQAMFGEAKKIEDQSKATSAQADSIEAAAAGVDVNRLEQVLEKLEQAIGKEGAEKDNIITDLNQGDNQAALKMMFGSEATAQSVADNKNLEALKSIRKALSENKGETAGKNGAELRTGLENVMNNETEARRLEANEQLKKKVKEMEKKMPSLFAANSTAMRDHNYGLYRGVKRESVDEAAQTMIWDQKGVETPTSAGAEAVGEELYTKIFKGMNYDQILRAASNVQTKSKGSADPGFEEKAIAQAIAYKLKDSGWMDDAGNVIKGQKTGRQALEDMRGTVFKKDPKAYDRMIASSDRHAASSATGPRLGAEGIEKMGGFLKSALGADAGALVTKIRTPGLTLSTQEEEKITKAINRQVALSHEGVHELEHFVRAIKNLDNTDLGKLTKHLS